MTCEVSGAITDNTATNKLAWKMLKERYKGMFFHRCVSHSLHLMVKDTFAATKTKWRGNLHITARILLFSSRIIIL